jgi:hypothetical protein
MKAGAAFELRPAPCSLGSLLSPWPQSPGSGVFSLLPCPPLPQPATSFSEAGGRILKAKTHLGVSSCAPIADHHQLPQHRLRCTLGNQSTWSKARTPVPSPTVQGAPPCNLLSYLPGASWASLLSLAC